jgi:hypothetical protein
MERIYHIVELTYTYIVGHKVMTGHASRFI